MPALQKITQRGTSPAGYNRPSGLTCQRYPWHNMDSSNVGENLRVVFSRKARERERTKVDECRRAVALI